MENMGVSIYSNLCLGIRNLKIFFSRENCEKKKKLASIIWRSYITPQYSAIVISCN